MTMDVSTSVERGHRGRPAPLKPRSAFSQPTAPAVEPDAGCSAKVMDVFEFDLGRELVLQSRPLSLAPAEGDEHQSRSSNPGSSPLVPREYGQSQADDELLESVMQEIPAGYLPTHLLRFSPGEPIGRGAEGGGVVVPARSCIGVQLTNGGGIQLTSRRKGP